MCVPVSAVERAEMSHPLSSYVSAAVPHGRLPPNDCSFQPTDEHSPAIHITQDDI